MKRNITIYFLLFAFFCINSLHAQTTQILDDDFENYLETHDSNGNVVSIGDPNSMGDGIDGNDLVLTSNISNVTVLTIQNYNISNFEGLQFFTSLTQFKHYNNQATAINMIDFYGNSQLTTIEIDTAPSLAEIDVSQNLKLTYLMVKTRGVLFNSIDLSKNLDLDYLNISYNVITNLNTEKNLKLSEINVHDNPITELKVSQLNLLRGLVTSETLIEELDLSNNNNLTFLYAINGALRHINVKNKPLITYLDLRNNPNLTCILVDDASYAETATNWYKDTTATYVEESIIIETEAQDIPIQYDSAGNYKIDIDEWLANNGGAVATSVCGEITWSYNVFEVLLWRNSNRIVYGVEFLATDIFGNTNSTEFYLTVQYNNHFEEETYGSGSTICDDIFDLNTVITDIDPAASLKATDIGYFSFERVSSFESNEGPSGTSFEGTIVDFPDTGAGSYSYLFKVSVERSINVYQPYNGEFYVDIDIETANITLNDKTVAFETEELNDIAVCPGDNLTIQDLTDLLKITPDPDVLEPQSPIDLNQYWTPSVYSGPGTYTFDPTDAFPNCPSNAVSITVTEELELSAGTNTSLTIAIGGTVTEAQLFEALQGEDTGGTWSPLPLAGVGTYTYTHAATSCHLAQSAEVVITESTLSVYENELLNNMSIFPNPTKEILYINGDISRLKNIEIYSITGQLILTVNKNLKVINLSALEPALYFMRLHTENATKVTKIIKM